MHPILYNLPWKVPYLGTITIYTYGVLLAAAYLLGLQLALTRAKARQLASARVMAQGTVVGLPKQQPAKKHPKRPMTCPSAIPGANTSQVVHSGSPTRLMYQRATVTATMSPP